MVEAVERDVALIRSRSAELADSGLAALAVALAYELENPYNSATSKAACAAQLVVVLEQLRALAPVEQEADALDDLRLRLVAQ
jgi:dienelactone hydrolase